MKNKKVVILEPGYSSYSAEQEILDSINAELVVVPEDASFDEVIAAIKDAEVVLLRDRPLPANIIEHMEKIKGIVRYGVGYDNVDCTYATAQKIAVANVPDYGADAVAEYALGLMLTASRQISLRDREVRLGAWNIAEKAPMRLMCGKTLGLVSFGRIAKCFLAKVSAMGLGKVLVHDPYVSAEDCVKYNVTPVDMDTLCKEADFISLHAPLTEATRYIINQKRLALMKSTTVIVNTGRGGLIDETALYNALASKQIFAAGIDVFEKEPAINGHPLFALTNCVVSDHTAWYSVESCRELQTKAAQEAVRILLGEQPKHWVNRW